MLITRSDIITILKDWENNKTSAKEVLNWASKRYFPGETDFDDWEGEDSAANEVLCELDSLDMNLVLPADISIHIEFLQTPKGKFEQGLQRWKENINQINFKKRCQELRDHEIYGPFCK